MRLIDAAMGLPEPLANASTYDPNKAITTFIVIVVIITTLLVGGSIVFAKPRSIREMLVLLAVSLLTLVGFAGIQVAQSTIPGDIAFGKRAATTEGIVFRDAQGVAFSYAVDGVAYVGRYNPNYMKGGPPPDGTVVGIYYDPLRPQDATNVDPLSLIWTGVGMRIFMITMIVWMVAFGITASALQYRRSLRAIMPK